MNMSLTQITIAVLMVGAAIALVYAIRQYMATQSERRMRTMLIKLGLDPTVVMSGDSHTLMTEVRQRCRNCSSEDTCERWLAGEVAGENEFCPNAEVFKTIKETMGAVGKGGAVA